MLGLCIIDEKTLYTTVAQAMFRLRKLNMGHRINFYIINKEKIDIIINEPKDIYTYLKINNKKIKKIKMIF